MRIDGHYDAEADIAWVRFEGYDPSTVVAEETDVGLRELDPSTGETRGSISDAHSSKNAEPGTTSEPGQLP